MATLLRAPAALSVPAARAVAFPARRAVAARAQVQVTSAYKAVPKGERASTDFRIFMESAKTPGTPISTWHDIPLANPDGTLNFVCEIPAESSAKMEVCTKEAANPIKQDIKKGNLRFYPYNINWNYGMLPQTWEDPKVVHPELEVAGDNDPVDVVEIGSTELPMGSVTPVKCLGALAMIDDGELDWKMICIAAADPLAAKLNDVEDVEREMPGELRKILEWFRDYKIPDGKPANKFGYNNTTQNAAFAAEVIQETNGYWKALRSGARANDDGYAL